MHGRRLARKVARASSESAALSKLKPISFIGPPVADSPLCNASRLEEEPGSGLGGAGGFGGAPVDALGFSAVHFGGGGLAVPPQEIRNVAANKFTP